MAAGKIKKFPAVFFTKKSPAGLPVNTVEIGRTNLLFYG